jgi:ATP-binding cassette, subfamily B, bacterial PglK
MTKLLNIKERKNFYLLVFLYSFFSILEVLNISLIFPIMEGLLENQTSKSVYSSYLKDVMGEENNLVKILLLFFLLFLFKNIYFIIITYFQNSFIFNFKRKVSNEIFEKLITSEYKSFNTKNSSSYLKNIIGDTTQVAQCIGMLIIFYSDLLVLLCIFIMLMLFNFEVTVLVFIILISLLIIYVVFFKKKFKVLGVDRYNKEEKLYKLLNNTFGSFTEIKLFKKEKYFSKLYDGINTTYIETLKKYDFLQSIPRAFFELFGITIIIAVIIFAKLKNEAQIANYLPLISIFSLSLIRLMPIFNRITISLQNIRYGRQTINILYDELRKYQLPIKNDKKFYKFNIKKNDSINVVNLNYKIDQKIILEDINLKFSLNSKIGIYGDSGSGKSTFVKIFSGLIKPTMGDIFVNNQSIFENISSWQNNIALLKQENFILDGTIKENICFGERDIDDQQLAIAIKEANLENMIKSLSMGLNTNIGENGNKISGGERQRICLARSFYFQKDILIFDEPTSSLDEENEREILQCINSIQDKLVILISHNKENFKNFDKIYYLKNGKLVSEN